MKHSLREVLRERRKALPILLRKQKTLLIWDRLKALPEFQTAKHILVYLSKEDEVGTHQGVQGLLHEGKKLYAPKLEDGHLFVYPLERWDDLKEGAFGILEPQSPFPTLPGELDLILVPGLGFCKNGHRIGYGKGHYDRFLKNCDAIKIGLAFHEQILDNEIPFEDHDIAVDFIVTDQTVLPIP